MAALNWSDADLYLHRDRQHFSHNSKEVKKDLIGNIILLIFISQKITKHKRQSRRRYERRDLTCNNQPGPRAKQPDTQWNMVHHEPVWAAWDAGGPDQ